MRKLLGVALAAAALAFANAGPALAADKAVGQKLCEKQGGTYEGAATAYLCTFRPLVLNEKDLAKQQKECEKAGGTLSIKVDGYKCFLTV